MVDHDRRINRDACEKGLPKDFLTPLARFEREPEACLMFRSL